MTLGPPGIDLFIHNARLSPVENRFTGMRTTFIGTMEEVIAGIGDHAGKGLYRILSLNATKYSVVLVILTDGTRDDIPKAFTEMKQKMMLSAFEKSRAALATQNTEAVSRRLTRPWN